MKLIFSLILLLFNLNILFAQNSFLEVNNFIKVDSLNLYRRDINTEFAFYTINSNFDETNTWNKAKERGVIENLNIKNLKNIKIIDFNIGQSKVAILYNYGINKTDIIVFRSYTNDNFNISVDNIMLELIKTLKDYQLLANPSDLKNTISEFAFKPFNWTEFAKIKMKATIKQNEFELNGEDFISILNSYQIASGNKTAVGQILAIKELVSDGNKITILNWKWGHNVVINDLQQLRGFILNYDPVIDILQNEEFR